MECRLNLYEYVLFPGLIFMAVKMHENVCLKINVCSHRQDFFALKDINELVLSSVTQAFNLHCIFKESLKAKHCQLEVYFNVTYYSLLQSFFLSQIVPHIVIPTL